MGHLPILLSFSPPFRITLRKGRIHTNMFHLGELGSGLHLIHSSPSTATISKRGIFIALFHQSCSTANSYRFAVVMYKIKAERNKKATTWGSKNDSLLPHSKFSSCPLIHTNLSPNMRSRSPFHCLLISIYLERRNKPSMVCITKEDR